MKRKLLNEMKLTLQSKSINESYARYAVSAFIGQLDPTVADLGEEYWSMVGRLNQPCRVQEECLMDCKLLLYGSNKNFAKFDASTIRIRIG